MYVWRAYSECRWAEIPFPEWVTTYLDEAARRVLELSRIPPRDRASAISEAFGFKNEGKSGRGNPFTQANDSRDLTLAAKVFEYVKDGHKPDLACEYVAKESTGWTERVSKSTVVRAWGNFKELLGHTD